MMLLRIIFLLILTSAFPLLAQTVYGDLLPDAPALASRGAYAVGVRTMQLTNPNQVNIAKTENAIASLYDRDLTVEIWYPIAGESGTGNIKYEEVLGFSGNEERPLIPFTFSGRATRDAAPLAEEEPYPLVIVSHGYVGSRYLMT